MIIPAGGRVSIIANTASTWITKRDMTHAITSNGLTMTSTSPSTVASLTVGPGTFAVIATGWFDVASGLTNQIYSARLFDGTTSLADQQITMPNATQTGPISIHVVYTTTAGATINFQVNPSNLGGTQLFRNLRLTAMAV